MRIRPWPIIIIALIHILAPFFNIYFSARLNHANFLEYLEYLLVNKHILENIFWMILPIVIGFSILKFRRWSYFLLITFSIFVSGIFIHEWWISPKMPLATFIGFEAVNIIILGYFLLPSVRNIYLKPSLRWWEQKPRYLIDQPILIQTSHATTSGHIRNISEGGALIDTSVDFSRGDRFKVSFEIFQKKFEMQTQVVHKSTEGYGTFFTQVLPSQNELNKLVDQLAIQGYPLRTEIPSWKESFGQWLKGAVRGKGIIPQAERDDQNTVRSTPKSKLMNSDQNGGT